PDDDQRVWVLGAGDQELVSMEREDHAPLVADASLEESAAELAALGLYTAAAEVAERSALAKGSAMAWLWAGRAWSRGGRVGRAEVALRRAVDGAATPDEWRLAADALMKLYDDRVDVERQVALLDSAVDQQAWRATWEDRLDRRVHSDRIEF